MRRSTAFYGRAMACFSIILAIGCPSSSSRMVPAGGTVTYNGIPVQGASVSFTPVAVKNGRAAIGSTNSDGRFALTTLNHDDGAIPGQYKVTVIKMENPQDAIGNGDKPEARMRFTGHHPRLMALKSPYISDGLQF